MTERETRRIMKVQPAAYIFSLRGTNMMSSANIVGFHTVGKHATKEIDKMVGARIAAAVERVCARRAIKAAWWRIWL